jgi:hypothetical protein
MGRLIPDRDISSTLCAADRWIKSCLIKDESIFTDRRLWTAETIQDVHDAFVGNPDDSDDDFITKLQGQMARTSVAAQHLMGEMLWALLLFPSNIRTQTKRKRVRDVFGLSGQVPDEEHPFFHDDVLKGIGSGGTGYNNYRYRELVFLIDLGRDLKSRSLESRQKILSNYDAFMDWIEAVPQPGNRQFRHMLRFFAFPDRVERMSSNGDRQRVLIGYQKAPASVVQGWSDRQLDEALLGLRRELEKEHPNEAVDFYAPKFKDQWARDRKVRTIEGEVVVTVPRDEDDEEDAGGSPDVVPEQPEARLSLQIQAKLAQIGAIMGFRIWVPRGDRERIRALVSEKYQETFLEDLPLNYDQATLDTVEQIDVLWLKGRSMARAFEVEHTTAVYSGLLRMADLLALQPNMNIRLHIVAPGERHDKVFREMRRPVFSLLDRGPLSRSCTFLSYEDVLELSALEHLAHTTDSIIQEYEESAAA